MTIYRGPGGGGNADSDAEINALTALTNQSLAYSEAAALEADAAAASAAAASTSAASAATSASGAATSATNAASSASSASTSASSASTSATNAASSASAASTSATNAASSASAASTSATNAAASETNAATSAASASTYATASAASAVTASTQASNAATSATAAAGSATSASTQASNAATSASGAATSATNAASSASAASVSAAAALASEVAAAASVASIDLPTIVRNNAAGAISVSSSSPALRITQLGTGNALLVEDSTNPDSSPFVIDASGNTVVGATTPLTNLVVSATPKFQVIGGGSIAGIGIVRTDASGGSLSFNGGSSGNNLASGSAAGIITAGGYDGSNYIETGRIEFRVDGTPGTNDMPGRLVFSTTADGAATPTERMRITSAGNVGIGTSSMTRFFNLYDTTTNAQTAYFKSTQASGGAGFVAYNNGGEAATFQINGSSNTSYAGANSVNIGSITNNNLAFITNNTERARIDSSGNVGIGTSSPNAFGNRTFEVSAGANSAAYILLTTNSNTIKGEVAFDTGTMYISTKTSNPMVFRTADATRMTIAASGAVSVSGSLSKGSGSFRIDHPLPALSKTHQLVHSFIEGPQADNIYRGKVTLVGGAATVNIDASSGMTEGTFVALNREVQCFTTNETGWVHVRGKVTGNLLTIEAQDTTCTDTISWMVIGERQDKHMYDTEWTDKDGKVIVEPLKDQPELEGASDATQGVSA